MSDPMLEAPKIEPSFDLEGGLDEREPFAAFVLDADSRAVAEQLILQREWQDASVEDGGVADCVRTCGVLPPPRVLLVDISDSDNPEADIEALKDALGDQSAVIAIGSVNDINLFRALTKHGVVDYLIKPITAEALDQAIETAETPAKREESDPSARSGHLVVMIGARGGIGTSTVVLNCGWLMAHDLNKNVALVDLDLQFGTLALALDLEPGHGLRDALESPDRVDELFIDRAMVKADDNLFVFGAEEPLDNAPNYETTALTDLLGELQGRFDYVLVDMPRIEAGARRKVLEIANDIVLVSDPSLLALRDTIRLKRLIDESAPNAKLTILANGVRTRNTGQLALKDFEKALGAPVKHSITYDEKLVSSSANIGQPLARVGKHSKPTVALQALSRALAGEEKASKKKRKRKEKDRK